MGKPIALYGDPAVVVQFSKIIMDDANKRGESIIALNKERNGRNFVCNIYNNIENKKVFSGLEGIKICDIQKVKRNSEIIKKIYVVGDGVEATDSALELLGCGLDKKKICIIPGNVIKAEYNILSQWENAKQNHNLLNQKPILRYIEYHVTDFCNLKCKGCGHHSNEVKELEFDDIDTFKKSLYRLSEVFANIEVFRLMGGEPLLNKELGKYIDILHKVFPWCNIKVVTNGLLYKNISDEMVNSIKEANAVVQVTQYPPTRKIIGQLIDLAEKKDIKIEIDPPVKEFYETIALENDTTLFCWENCSSRNCHFLRRGILYPCVAVWTHYAFYEDKQYKIDKKTHDKFSWNLLNNVESDGWDIIQQLERPFYVCKLCGSKKRNFKWSSETVKEV